MSDPFDYSDTDLVEETAEECIARLTRERDDADRTLAGFTVAVREAREALVQIRDLAVAEEARGGWHTARIVRLCDGWLSPPLAAVPAARVLTEGQP